MTEDRRYYTPTELADLLRVSALTIRRMIARGELRAFKVGPRNLRVPASELERIEAAGVTPTPARSRKAKRARGRRK